MSELFKKIYDQSIQNPEKFWQEASEDIFWFKMLGMLVYVVDIDFVKPRKLRSRMQVTRQ